MSRETDSSSSGPQGRGGAAYPSGTPPYGSRQYPSLNPTQEEPSEAPEPAEPPRPEEKKTETTLTTRIRINIPGSRPIPPVVMRTPMGEGEGESAGDRPDPERTVATPAPGPVPGAPAPGAPAASGSEGPDSGADGPAPAKSGSDWFAPRKNAPAPPAGESGGPADRSGGPSAAGASGDRPAGTPPRADLPGFPGGPQQGFPGGPPPGGTRDGGPGGPRSTPDFGVRPPGPGGPTTGPAAGTASFAPGGQGGPGQGPGAQGPGAQGLSGQGPGAQGPRAQGPGVGGPAGGPGGPGAPTGPAAGNPFGPGPGGPHGGTGGPGPGGPGGGTGGPRSGVPPRMSDDTAILTPQQPAPEPRGGHVSGDTLTGGIPVIPGGPRPFPGGPGSPDGPTAGGPDSPEPARRTPAPAPAPRKKGRSKVTLLGVAAVVLLGVAYGAGLLLNHSEVPKGTSVLGVDIGGGTKQEAVDTLDKALGKRAQAPMTLSVDGKEAQLDPEKAGLGLDAEETVRGAAGSDYNPVSVIGSLFGGDRPADPVIPVDEEKLGAALTELAGVSGTAGEGTIKFEPNKAIAVPGKSGQRLDVNQSIISVRDAYRAQVQTGKASTVELPVSTQEPTITQAELDRAMKEFAEPAMSGLITIKAGPKEIQFGPARSLPQILSMKAIDGRLVDHYDKQAIETLCDGVFDGIMAVKADGKKHQVGPDDVAQAMKTALTGKTPAERTVTIDLTGAG
ncbi:hypothetical protein [uncultured Streptomyces sp.]|uniref:hypothetical protein n=1 Tax=uncultured Streptomyces sp. TaxID=174707 RepID=UPI0026207FD6|nr:hypothetical protein [uncultured Streptomyces sp.]